jgi:hypothetical protein
MANTTFSWNGARITIHPLTAEDELDAEINAEFLRGDDAFDVRGNYKRQQFSECLASIVEVDGDLGFPLPNGSATPEDLQAAYAAFLKSVGLLKLWRAALRSIELEKK